MIIADIVKSRRNDFSFVNIAPNRRRKEIALAVCAHDKSQIREIFNWMHSKSGGSVMTLPFIKWATSLMQKYIFDLFNNDTDVELCVLRVVPNSHRPALPTQLLCATADRTASAFLTPSNYIDRHR